MPSNIRNLLLFSVFALVLNLIITPLIMRLADKKGFYDHPDHRKIHNDPISNVGGVGFSLSTGITLFLYSYFFEVPGVFFMILPGALFMHILGLLDDRLDVKARYKLIVQIFAATTVAAGGVLIDSLFLPFWGVTFNFGFLAYPLTIFWIIAVSNAVNLIDGIDGQAGGISLIALLVIGTSHYINGAIFPAFLSFILAATVLSFLVFNFPPAKIFMGDGGSLILGFAIAVLPLLNGDGSLLPLAGPLTVIMIPVLDVFASIIRRRRKGLHFFIADREHTHHKLLDFGLTNRQILSIVYTMTALFAFISLYWTLEMNILSFIMMVSAWTVGFSLFIVLDRKYENKIRAKRCKETLRLIS